MDAVALLVDLRLHDGSRDAFVARVRSHAALCLEKEPGCLGFTVLVPEDDPDLVVLCEVYSDQAAIDHHLSTDHMKSYLADTGGMIAERRRRVCRVPGPVS